LDILALHVLRLHIVTFVICASLVDARSARAESEFSLRLDAHFAAEPMTDNILDAFRLGFWAKDRAIERLAMHVALTSSAKVLGRIGELVLLDIPFGAYATVVPHEIMGHGGRLREFGLHVPGYRFLLTPPYGFTPSYTAYPKEPLLPDQKLLLTQTGIAVEGYEARQLVRRSLTNDLLSHFEAGLILGIRIHELIEALEPFPNDVLSWTQELAELHGGTSRRMQQRYLVALGVATLLDPNFWFAAYHIGWEFVGHGQRSTQLPALHVRQVALWVQPHVTPVPWGIEYELPVFVKFPQVMIEVEARVGIGHNRCE
jgi:hypothetical protein